MKESLKLPMDRLPRVLLLGNGILRLSGGGDWGALLKEISLLDALPNLEKVPYAMQPECLCGVDVDEVQRRTAAAITDGEADRQDVLKRLLSLPFDAILTTNYTYEIERALTGRPWTEAARSKAFTVLDGSAHVRHNTCVCSLVKCANGRTMPVFHIHGERGRKHSLVLSYYSYANAVARLIGLNKKRGNAYQEHQMEQRPLACWSWLDWFLMGEVYAVGFGFDPSEFDIWWAIERKARENADHGLLHAYMIGTEDEMQPQQVLFEPMKVDLRRVSKDNGFPVAYERILNEIQKEVNGDE